MRRSFGERSPQRDRLMPSTIAIAQPTFLPWAGWFDLADQVELLILLDDVAFSKQSWQQRNRLRTARGLEYVTVPVRSSGRFGQRIIDTEIADMKFLEKTVRTIAQNYRRARFFAEYFGELREVLEKSVATGSLASLNCTLIAWLSDRLGIKTPRIHASDLGVMGKRGEYVAKLCERVGASTYISPVGAEDYLLEDRAEFERRSISVKFHVYEHPAYRQCFEPFVPYASALDLLLNEGNAAGGVLRSGRRPARDLSPTCAKEQAK